MHSWWQRDIIGPGKLPLLVCFAAFVITFLTTRGITRAIRAGRGPFHNISEGGTHVHHAVPGIILLVAGAFLAVDSTPHTAAAVIAAAAVGIGTSLVLDEFALILHLQDDYWTADKLEKQLKAVREGTGVEFVFTPPAICAVAAERPGAVAFRVTATLELAVPGCHVAA